VPWCVMSLDVAIDVGDTAPDEEEEEEAGGVVVVKIGHAINTKWHFPCVMCSQDDGEGYNNTWKSAGTRAKGLYYKDLRKWRRVCAPACFAAWLEQATDNGAAPAPPSSRSARRARAAVASKGSGGGAGSGNKVTRADKLLAQVAAEEEQREAGIFSILSQRKLIAQAAIDILHQLPLPHKDGHLELPGPARRLNQTGQALSCVGVEAATALATCRTQFPHLPLVISADPTNRARACKPDSDWTPAAKQDVLDIFLSSINFFVCIPELTCREDLLADDRFAVKDADGNVKPGCVRLICQTCRSNEHVQVPTTTGNSGYNVHKHDRVSGYLCTSVLICTCCIAFDKYTLQHACTRSYARTDKKICIHMLPAMRNFLN
jgi:hypothetical protein